MTNTLPTHIIAIGASAGGLEELTSFFDHTPQDGVAYVIVQHLSSAFKSNMVDILKKHSKLHVFEAENGMQLFANVVCLIPNDKYMTISDGHMYLIDKETLSPPHLTVNMFFNSLAVNSGSHAIAIVFSGLGSDGTEGIKAVKHAGGMIMAREPETSEFPSMPANAIATGLVDFVLEPKEMPMTIEDYILYGLQSSTEPENDEKNLKIILEIANTQLPLDFSEYKQTTILRRIKRRASLNNFTTLESYIDFLKVTPEEVETLVQSFLISVTSFFRVKGSFQFLETDVIPEMLSQLQENEELKIWVAGCATGEEAYSMAILIHEQMGEKYKNTTVKIFATDVDNVALIVAGKGVYNEAIAKEVSPERLERYFTKENNLYKIKPEIRKMIIFAPHDLVKNPPYCNIHFISCRNLLIYMTPALQKKVYAMLLFGLKSKGYLFLGSSENPIPILQHLEVVSKKWRVYRNNETKKMVQLETFSMPQMINIGDARTAVPRREIFDGIESATVESIAEVIAQDMGYVSIAIDENNNVIKTFGDTSKYLLQKNFNVNLLELLPRPLAVAFNTTVIAARKSLKQTTALGVEFTIGETKKTVNLSVHRLLNKSTSQGLILVTMHEGVKLLSDTNVLAVDSSIHLDDYTLMMEGELGDLKDRLQSVYKQLDASNDNMQSYNEELLSANEEMQSTNEEMQSVNEELHTINTDYHLKNKELLDLNDDLNNYFRSNQHGQLFVNNKLELMKYSPGAVRLINLLPTDIGRPLSHMSTNLKLETITADIDTVIASGTTLTREIQDNSGKWYQIMTMPYIQQVNNERTGAILTFNDITAIKKTEQELKAKNESLVRINEDLDNFVNTASHDLLAPLGNIETSIQIMNSLKNLNPELATFLKVIDSSVKKFRALINEIASIGKIENENRNVQAVDMQEVITNIEWSLQDEIKESSATIKQKLGVKSIRFSKKNMRSILYNLISNAIKYCGSVAPNIIIETSAIEDGILLSVKDNGIGLSEADQEKIWGMYSRVNHNIDGQGIGLYLTKKIVDSAGGKIRVTSTEGNGCTFEVVFSIDK